MDTLLQSGTGIVLRLLNLSYPLHLRQCTRHRLRVNVSIQPLSTRIETLINWSKQAEAGECAAYLSPDSLWLDKDVNPCAELPDTCDLGMGRNLSGLFNPNVIILRNTAKTKSFLDEWLRVIRLSPLEAFQAGLGLDELELVTGIIDRIDVDSFPLASHLNCHGYSDTQPVRPVAIRSWYGKPTECAYRGMAAEIQRTCGAGVPPA